MSKLYLVPTPIGNLEDMTYRAVRILKEVNLILAEDTRKTGILLKHYNISNALKSHHMHNEHRTAEEIASRIAAGESVALVTDAGTPGISDPGFLLVRTCVEAGIEVETLPGATAFVPALVNSGLPCDRFHFEGFIPHKKGRQTRLQYLSTLPFTFVLYESPFRLAKTLMQLSELCGQDRKACVSRELTKFYEENKRGSLTELALHYTTHPPKGEIVMVVAGNSGHETNPDDSRETG
ncbi:MAG: 16S rRNA (cytidine(1402)-2'-O)-methyltransferase [Lentimicrobium sp.]|nr:16S rRNA (cytidine(1402)-2'-O)-methyltransferase [Lentimicrobium sp.]